MLRETTDYQGALRRLTLNDRRFVREVLADADAGGMDDGDPVSVTEHLVRLGVLIALDAAIRRGRQRSG